MVLKTIIEIRVNRFSSLYRNSFSSAAFQGRKTFVGRKTETNKNIFQMSERI